MDKDSELEEGTEEPVVSVHDQAADEGAERLHRSWRVLVSTGFMGGSEISVGLLAYLLVLDENGSHVLAGLAFSVGFIALFLAHSELFTEGFYYPAMAIVNGRGTVWQLLRLWAVTLVTNLLGGLVVVALIVAAFPRFNPLLAESAHQFLQTGLSWQGVALAILAGASITLVTRMRAGSDHPVVTLAAALSGGVVLAGGSLFHCVLDSIILFGAILSGADGVGWLDWLAWVWWVIPLNVLGGLLLTTAPRVLRSHEVREASGRR